MKKFSTVIKNWSCRAALVAALAMPAISCSQLYDDTQVREEIEQIKKELADLEESLNTELNAIKELLAGQITITKLEPKSDGSILVTLSNGSTFTVYPKGATLPENLITVLENEEGVLCWAQYDKDGNATLILVDGESVPVDTATPEVRVGDDGVSIEISFDGGQSWTVTGYTESVADALISNIEVVYSDWQVDSEGNPLPLYCVVTMTDGAEVKVGMNSRLILDYDSAYVAAGTKSELVATAEDAADFIITTPQGWNCDVTHDAKASRFTISISSPSSAEIKSGEAVGEGVAKFIVVFNNGMSAIASIKLSTTPVYYSYLLKNITLTVGGGVEEIVCGLVEASAYSAATAAENANNYLADNSQKSAYGVTFKDALTVNISASQLCSTLAPGKEYTFWYAIPKAANGVKSVTADEISTEEYIYCVPTFEVSNESFFDVNVKFEVSGSKGFLVGYSPKASYSNSACLNFYRDNKDSGITLKQDVAYNGSFLEYFGSAGSALEQNTTYTAWYLECGGCEDVTTDNICRWDFTTKAFENGGNVEITSSDAVVDYTTIEVKLNTEGHIYMYYTFLESYMVSGYPSDEDKLNMLISEGTKLRTNEEAIVRYRNATPGSKLTLVAMAVGEDGKYGKIFTQEFAMKSIVYSDSLDLTLTTPDSPSITSVRAMVSCENAAYYNFVCAPIGSNEWKKTYGGSAKKAGEYMIINPTGKGVCSTKNEVYALETDDNGNSYIVVRGLTELEHALVVIAYDAEGNYSQAKAVYFTPTVDMGTIVRRSDPNWAMGKPTVVLGKTQEIEFFNISWYVAPVEGYTAYTMAGNPIWLVDDCPTVEQLMAYIIADCSKDDSVTSDHGQKCEYSADGYSISWENPDGTFYEENNLPGVYNSFFYGDKGYTMIYTIWVDSDGNFHEPMVYDPTEDMEITDWTWN